MRLIKKLWDFKHLFSICLVYTVLITVAFLYPLKGITITNFIIPIDKLIHVLGDLRKNREFNRIYNKS